MDTSKINFNVSLEELLADLTYAVHQVIIEAGIDFPFIKMELDLQSALGEVVKKDRFLGE